MARLGNGRTQVSASKAFAPGLLSLAVPGGIKDQSVFFILLEAMSFLKWEEANGQVTQNSCVQGRGGRDV